MNNYLKEYNVELNTIGPVFIGSGQEIKKKEYILKDNQVVIPNINSMYRDLVKLNKQGEFETYMLDSRNRNDLGSWLKNEKIPITTIENWTKYALDCGDAIAEKGRALQIMSCIKDAYDKPYVPGSSLKGMLRTILLSYEIKKDPTRFNGVKRNIEENVRLKTNRNRYLKREEDLLEEKAFNKLGRTEKTKDIVNDIMAGLIVGDSEPLALSDLTLCQKIERHIDGSESRLNLLRECIKPNTKIRFKITVDSTMFKYSIKELEEAIAMFGNCYYKLFSSRFPTVEKPDDSSVWIGGGAGYISKTIIYPMFENAGYKVVKTIFDNTNVPRSHKHDKDIALKLSPHILKITQYQGQKLQFGLCQLNILEAF